MSPVLILIFIIQINEENSEFDSDIPILKTQFYINNLLQTDCENIRRFKPFNILV